MPRPGKAPVLRATSLGRRDFGLLRAVLLLLPEDETVEATRAFAGVAPECAILVAESVEQAADLLSERPISVVIGEAEVRGEGLAHALAEEVDVPVVVVVDEGDERRAIEAVENGALDWVARSESLVEALPHIALGAAREWRQFGLRRAAEEQLFHADRLALVGRMAAGVIHEVGTPLNVIRMRAQLLQMNPDRLDEATATIVEQCDRITEMLKQTLVLARKSPAGRERVDLLEVANRAHELIGPTLRRSHVTCTVEGEPAVVQGDASELLQVTLNLLSNAMDAMDNGGHIDVMARVDDGVAKLSVRDSGPGVAAEHLPHLFAPFFTTKEAGRGTGLGLSVSAEIARAHGGRITVASVRGRGTTFVVELPAI